MRTATPIGRSSRFCRPMLRERREKGTPSFPQSTLRMRVGQDRLTCLRSSDAFRTEALYPKIDRIVFFSDSVFAFSKEVTAESLRDISDYVNTLFGVFLLKDCPFEEQLLAVNVSSGQRQISTWATGSSLRINLKSASTGLESFSTRHLPRKRSHLASSCPCPCTLPIPADTGAGLRLSNVCA